MKVYVNQQNFVSDIQPPSCHWFPWSFLRELLMSITKFITSVVVTLLWSCSFWLFFPFLDCKDTYTKCRIYAAHGMCNDPDSAASMVEICPKSCNACWWWVAMMYFNRSNTRESVASDTQIQRSGLKNQVVGQVCFNQLWGVWSVGYVRSLLAIFKK